MSRAAHLRIFLCLGTLALALGPVVAPGADAADDADQTVVLRNIEFRPSQIRVAVGDRIKFVNQDPFTHDIYLVRTANRNLSLGAPTTLGSGESTIVTISEGGLYTLYCTIHGGMRGNVSTTGSFTLSEEERAQFAHVVALPPIVKTGEALFWSKAQCFRCHRIGDRGEGLRGPNLEDVGFRARARAQALELDSATAYIAQSVLQPDAYVVEGYSNDMPRVYQPPIGLTAEDVTAVITYLQSQGGEVDTWAIDLDRQVLARPVPDRPLPEGDADDGEDAFTEFGCMTCHTVGDRFAKSPGPDLTAIGAYRNATWLTQAIVDPNAEVGANWKTATVQLDSGESAAGILRKNGADEVALLVGHERVRTFPRARVKRVDVQEASKMPAFSQLMTVQQLADIVSYLETLTGPPAAPPGAAPPPPD